MFVSFLACCIVDDMLVVLILWCYSVYGKRDEGFTMLMVKEMNEREK